MKFLSKFLRYNYKSILLINLYITIHSLTIVKTSYDEYINQFKWNEMLISNHQIPINLTCQCTENQCDEIGLSTCLTSTHGFCYKKIQYNHLTKKIECHQGCAPKEYNRLACNINIPEYGQINFKVNCCNSHDLCNSIDSNDELYCSETTEEAVTNKHNLDYHTFLCVYLILMIIGISAIIIYLIYRKMRRKYIKQDLKLKTPLMSEKKSVLSNEINVISIIENLDKTHLYDMKIKWRGLEVIFKCFSVSPRVNSFTNYRSIFKWKKQLNLFYNFRLTHNSIIENYGFDYTQVNSTNISIISSISDMNYLDCFYSLTGCFDYSLEEYFISNAFKNNFENSWIFDTFNSSTSSCFSSYSEDEQNDIYKKKIKPLKVTYKNCSSINSNNQSITLIQSLVSSLIEGVWYLHTNISQCQNTKPSIAHGNLNVKNIKIRIDGSGKPICMISDLSWCVFESNKCICSSIKKVLEKQMIITDECLCQTLHTDEEINENKAFLSPEQLNKTIIKDIKVSTYISSWMQADIYSIGLIMWYIYDTILQKCALKNNKINDIYGNIVKSGNKIQINIDQLLTIIQSNIRPLNNLNHNIKIFENLYDLINQCWDTNPYSRLNIYRIKIILEDVFN